MFVEEESMESLSWVLNQTEYNRMYRPAVRAWVSPGKTSASSSRFPRKSVSPLRHRFSEASVSLLRGLHPALRPGTHIRMDSIKRIDSASGFQLVWPIGHTGRTLVSRNRMKSGTYSQLSFPAGSW